VERALEKRPWLVPLILLGLSILFLKAVLLPGSPTGGLDGQDFRSMFYPLQESIQLVIQSGQLPLWNPHQFIGHPFIGNPHAALFYPGTWFMWVVGVIRGMNWMMVLHGWLGAWGVAVLMRRFKATHLASLLAGILYATGGWAAARYYAGHYNLFVVFGLVPWMMVAYHRTLALGTIRSLLPAMAITGMALLAGYPPMVLYGGLMLVCLWVYHTVQADDWDGIRRAGWYAGWRLTAVVVGGLILGAALVIPAAELTALSARSDSTLTFANSFALPPAQLLSLALPGFFGNPKVAPYYYWGADFFEEFTAYVGLIPLLAALLAIPLAIRHQRREVWLWLGMMVLGLLMAVGLDEALMPLLWRWVPGFTSFRTPGRSLYFVMFGLIGLAAALITVLQQSDLARRRELLRISVRWGLPIAAATSFVAAMFFSGWYASASHVEPMPLRAFIISGVLATTGMLLLGLWLIGWLWTHDAPQATRWALVLTCLFVVFDVWRVGTPIITVSPIAIDPLWAGAQTHIPSGADARVVSPVGMDNLASVTGLYNVTGYDPLPVETYRKLQAMSDPGDPTTPVNTLLGVKYLLATKPYDKPNWKLIGIVDSGIYYQRQDAFPRAWVASSAVVEPNDDAVRQHIVSGKEDLQATVYIDHAVTCPAAGGTATITDYQNDNVSIQTAGNGGWLVLSDQNYPGWQATVDGQPQPIIRTDTVFRGVCVPAGDHVVTFNYHPLSLIIGIAVSVIGWLLWVLLTVLGLLRRHPAKVAGAV
jgi:hypothetical protein